MSARPLVAGKVRLTKDAKRGGWLARQRWPHEGVFYRSQGWGRTRGDAQAVLEDTKAEHVARLVEAAEQAEREAAAELRGIPHNATLSDLFPRWMAWRATYKPLSPSTVASYRDSWARFSKVTPDGSEEPLGDIGIEDLTSGHVTNASALALLGPESGRRLTILRALLTWAHSQGTREDRHLMAQYVPESDRNAEKAASDDQTETVEPRAIQRTEHVALVGHVEAAKWHHARSLYDLGHVLRMEWHLGIRIGELLALRFRDFHLDAEVPYVTVAATIIIDEGGERRAGRRKGGAKRIHLRLAPEVQAIVAERSQRSWRTEPDDLLFAVKNSGRHVQAGNLRRTLRRVVAEQDDRSLDGLSFHCYKRGLASDVEQVLSEAGVEAASDLTGTSRVVLRQHYIKVRGLRILDRTVFRVTGEPEGADNAA